MKRLEETLGVHVDPASIRWCVTVPALWSETAKDFMRSAATRAGECLWNQAYDPIRRLLHEAMGPSACSMNGKLFQYG